MIKKLFLLLAFTNGFIPTQVMGKAIRRRVRNQALSTHSKKARKKVSQRQENNPATLKPATQNNQPKKYFTQPLIAVVVAVAGTGGLATYSYTANDPNEEPTSGPTNLSNSNNPDNDDNISLSNSQDEDNNDNQDVDDNQTNSNDILPVNNSYVLPDLTIPNDINPENIEVKLAEAFADNDPKNPQILPFFLNKAKDFSADYPLDLWSHHLSVKQCMVNNPTDYEETRNKYFYRPAYSFSTDEISTTEQTNLEATLKECEGKPMFYHCTRKHNIFFIMLRSQFIMPAWGGAYPGAFISTKPEVNDYGGFIFALREEAAWDSPAMTTCYSDDKCWAGLNAPISLLTYLEGIYIDESQINSNSSFEEIKKEVYEIKFGLLQSLREKFNASTDDTEKKQIIELFTNVQNIKVKRYSQLDELPKNKQVAPKTWPRERKCRYNIHIISNSNGIPRLVESANEDDLFDANGNKLKQVDKLLVRAS